MWMLGIQIARNAIVGACWGFLSRGMGLCYCENSNGEWWDCLCGNGSQSRIDYYACDVYYWGEIASYSLYWVNGSFSMSILLDWTQHHRFSFRLILHHKSSFRLNPHHKSSFRLILHHTFSFRLILHHTFSFRLILHHKSSFRLNPTSSPFIQLHSFILLNPLPSIH